MSMNTVLVIIFIILFFLSRVLIGFIIIKIQGTVLVPYILFTLNNNLVTYSQGESVTTSFALITFFLSLRAFLLVSSFLLVFIIIDTSFLLYSLNLYFSAYIEPTFKGMHNTRKLKKKLRFILRFGS